MRILFDQGTPLPLRAHFRGHQISTTWQRGWARLANGRLLAQAENDGDDLLITTDQNLRYQQNLAAGRLAILVLPVANWPALQRHAASIAATALAMQPGEYLEWQFPP